ncbi:MAG TPA: LysR family transcriptional regulator [Terriglobales bacterium]|nr:LysR family transcriptional regulator [Terriglobales bacterium]
MDLFQLETFLTVAREGSFSRAAKKLYRTQPAVSQTVRKLEDEIGESLFDRSSREGILTDTGRVLLEYAEKLLNMRTEAIGALQELREMTKGKLSIAANELTCLYLLPVLNDFRRLHPMVKVIIERSLASRIPDELLNHSVEMGVLTFRPDDSLRSILVYRDELAFVVPPNHPLARSKEVSIRQLGAEYFVAHHVASPYRAKVLETFHKRKVPLHMDVEMPTIEALKKFVAMGNGVALIPAITIENELERGELVRVPCRDLVFERKVRLVYRKNATLSHAARAFMDIAQSFAEREGGRYMFQQER